MGSSEECSAPRLSTVEALGASEPCGQEHRQRLATLPDVSLVGGAMPQVRARLPVAGGQQQRRQLSHRKLQPSGGRGCSGSGGSGCGGGRCGRWLRGGRRSSGGRRSGRAGRGRRAAGWIQAAVWPDARPGGRQQRQQRRRQRTPAGAARHAAPARAAGEPCAKPARVLAPVAAAARQQVTAGAGTFPCFAHQPAPALLPALLPSALCRCCCFFTMFKPSEYGSIYQRKAAERGSTDAGRKRGKSGRTTKLGSNAREA